MLARLAWIGFVACLLACGPRSIDVTLLTFNDFHGALGDGGIDPATGRPWGGALALAAHVRAVRLAQPRSVVFLLDAGDTWQGTPESNLSFGRSTAGFMNRLGVDAAALGNHEFDWGVDTLVARQRGLRYPLLAANVFGHDGSVPPWARGSVVLDRAGVRLGVVGFITPETPKVTLPQNVAHLVFPPPERQIDSLVAHVRAQGADLVVLLCHIGAWQDSAGTIVGPLADLARRARGVDAIVGGHTHTYVSGTVAGIPIVIAGTKGRGLGKIVLRWDGRRVVAANAHWTRVVADSLPVEPDARVAAFVDSVRRVTLPSVQRVVTRTSRRLDQEALARFVAEAMRQRLQADVAVANLGGVRTEFEVGSITEGDVFELVPFENSLASGWMRGEALREFIACNPHEARLAGLRWNRPLPAATGAADDDAFGGGSGSSGVARLPDLVDTEGRPLDPQREYRVVTNNFLASGGDGFAGFLAARELTWTELRIRDVVRDALQSTPDLGAAENAKRAETSRGGRSLRSVKSE